MWRKILIGLVIAIPAAYGGIKLYAAHSISNTADKAINLLAPFADIRYQGTTSSLDGMVGITGVTVHILKNNEFYSIGAIKIKSDNLFTLLNIDSKLRDGEIPKTFGIDMEKVTLPMTGELVEKSGGDYGVLGPLGGSSASQHCGNRTRFSVDDLAKMGVTQRIVSLDIEVQREPRRNAVRLGIKIDSPGLNAADVDARFAVANGASNLRDLKGLPALESATIKFRDQGWHKRMETFCEKQSGMTEKAWLTARVSDLKQGLARKGVGVGNALLNAYRDFMKDGGTLAITFTPQNPVKLTTLHLYSLQDAMYYLAPTLNVNGKEVANLDISSIKPVGQDSGSQTAFTAALVNDNYNYKTIPLGKLRRYVGKRVRLTTDNSNVFAGKLDAVSGRIATVDVKNYRETDEEIVLLTRVVKTEVATSLKPAKPIVH